MRAHSRPWSPSACDRVPRAERRGRTALWLAVGLVALAAIVAWLVRGSLVPQRGAAVDPRDEVLRERVAALVAQGSTGEALQALEPLLQRPRPAGVDLTSAAAIRLQNMGDVAAARELLQRAKSLDPKSAAIEFHLGQCELSEGNFAAALEHFERVLELAPDDLPTRLALGDCLEALDRPREAESHYRAIQARGLDFGGSWYKIAVYRLSRLCFEDPARLEEAQQLSAEHDRIEERGVPTPTLTDIQRGELGRVARPAPRGNRPAPAGILPSFGEPVAVLAELAGLDAIELCDLDNDGRVDVLAWGEAGCALALQESPTKWRALRLADVPCRSAAAFDLDNDDDLDVLTAVSDGSELALYEGRRAESQQEGQPGELSWAPWSGRLPWGGGTPSDWALVDFDHEGDLDLLAVGAFGVRLLRYDGRPPVGQEAGAGGFTDVTEEAGLPLGGAFEWCLVEDLDADQDVDLLLGSSTGVHLASNLRGGRFEDQSARLSQLTPHARSPVVADLDGDARPDLWARGLLHLGQPSANFAAGLGHARTFEEARAALEAAAPANRQGAVLDLDFDGSLDLLGAGGGLLKLGLSGESAFRLEALQARSRLADLDGLEDGVLAWDLLTPTTSGLEIRRGSQSGAKVVRLGFRGTKDNRRGLGAIVELRAGGVYRRIFWRGEPELVGVGEESQIDYVWVTWPNGSRSQDTSRGLGDRAVTKDGLGLIQPSSLVGSCPFLYAWNGERYEFISDVLGITPLGLPMAPGALVPPDHDEYVLVRGDQLEPVGGFLELQFTEELREVTYLDRVRLDVVDHPSDVRVLPNERFTFPPFPQPHVHSLREPLAPVRAVDQSGRDWAEALARADDEYAVPFRPAPEQFLGLATPHSLELAFDSDAIASASKLRLVLTGWFYWTDASVNMAAARDPEQEFVPPILFVPDGEGGWRETGPPIGFPAGKTKSMVVDVTAFFDRRDPRLMLSSTLRLYWDEILLAVDGDDAPQTVTALEPAAARLWERGWSVPAERVTSPHEPERFLWERTSETPRWNQHPGQYTRLGDVLPLLGAIDDRFVIMGSGDALTLRFDARQLPPLPPGWTRDYLVFLDGWAKDRDPNTQAALYVEPLPFHGMSAYPYPSEESFPDTPEHRQWRQEWLTRPARRWLPLQAPPQAPPTAAAAPPQPRGTNTR